ncbi:acyltransferase [Thiomicrorhabdus immobilis]|uniref:L-ornithine N(alpha)-acyltransferase n=1 Tax=Thiomicrorhabdus immobilis TaxID=2791037 RepID=A0ABM7MFP3_9GAMM|nr:lysophospholipid acyltransferase family protein [Thiomicrorhabdus immobilis]BCN94333.1 acyltransferase [Thiomicrorhabdus immobilis]
MLDIEATLDKKFPQLNQSTKGRLAKKIIKRFSHEDEINQFIRKHPHLEGSAFIHKAFEHFNFSYRICSTSRKNIPSQGRVIIVANHPIGTLDGMALVDMVRSIRKDVKVVANELLYQVKPLRSCFFPINNMSPNASHKTQFKAMTEALNADQAVIIFPAGEVSRLGRKGIKDSEWKTGFLKLAKKTNSPILPLHIEARNSAFFYGLSMLYKPLSTMLLVNEMFNKNNHTIGLKTGKLIPIQAIENSELPLNQLAQKIKQCVYKLKSKKEYQPAFTTVDTISHPACRQSIRNELKTQQHLLTTPTGLDLYIVDYKADSALMHELGRVRELTFRAVGEGTGTCWDLDQYDQHYRHLILWDDAHLEIAGGYRLGECQKLIEKHGQDSLYMNHMFTLQPSIKPYLEHTLELGRCFVQPKYWGSRALDYLWFGMGSYLSQNPQIKYLMGSISLSNSYSEYARELIVSYYNTQFPMEGELANAKCPFVVSEEIQQIANSEFTGSYAESFARLNDLLEARGEKLPMLFKQYVELSDDKGTRFIDFNVAPDFCNAIGALVVFELDKIKESKKKRYLNGFSKENVA